MLTQLSTIKTRLAIEAASRMGWDRYTGAQGDCVCVDRFGASAKGEDALRELGFNVENVLSHARNVLHK